MTLPVHTIDRAEYPCAAAVAERIRGLVADGYEVAVVEAGVALYHVEGIEGSALGGPAYWLRGPTGRHAGTVADVGTLVRYAAALPRPVAPVSRRRTRRQA